MEDIQKFIRGQIYWRKWDENQKDVPGIISKSRPVVIVSNNYGLRYSSVATVVPLTTTDKSSTSLPTHVHIRMNGGDSYALCENVTTVSQSDLHSYVGTLFDDKMAEIDRALSECLGIEYTQYVEINDTAEKNTVEEADQVDSNEAPNTTSSSNLANRFQSRTWTPEMASEFVSDYCNFKKKLMSLDDMLSKWKFSSINSVYSTYHRLSKSKKVAK